MERNRKAVGGETAIETDVLRSVETNAKGSTNPATFEEEEDWGTWNVRDVEDTQGRTGDEIRFHSLFSIFFVMFWIR